MEINICSVEDFKNIKNIKEYNKFLVNSYAYENCEFTRINEKDIENMLEQENTWLMCYADKYGIMDSASLNIKFYKKEKLEGLDFMEF